MTDDLKKAQALLLTGQYTCVLCKGPQTITSTDRGVRPLVKLLEAGNLHGFCAADKVVGKATAFLYILLGVRTVYTPIASTHAVHVLQEHGIELFCDKIVPSIFNRNRSGLCPMETAVMDICDPYQAHRAILITLSALQ